MQVMKIPKKKGSFRTVVCPDKGTKDTLRSMCGNLDKKARKICPDVIHGFTKGRNPVTNAQAHVQHAYTLNFDLKDFFDSVTVDKLAGKLSKEEIEVVIVDPKDGRGPRACQGLPTSPAVANIAAAPLDEAILSFLKKNEIQAVYTRYGDDMSFSFDDSVVNVLLQKAVPQIVGRCGFKVNKDKTHLMAAAAGRRNITGIMVDDHGVHPTRDLKRRLRAAKHNLKEAQANNASAEELGKLKGRAAGLAGAVMCKLPKQRISSSPLAIDGMDWKEVGVKLSRLWRLGKFYETPSNNSEVVDGDFVVTRDPAYMLGMSTYTTGWTSCMSHPSGQYRRGTVFWYGLSGTSVATLLSDKTKVFAGVERRVMRARCLLHTFRDGTIAYDRCYGDYSSIQELKDWLESRGCIPTTAVKLGSKVVGASTKGVPYFDTLRRRETTTKKGRKAFEVVC